ncbi:TIGR04500 family putative peptide maturation system protein [Nakamurella sp. GG22]
MTASTRTSGTRETPGESDGFIAEVLGLLRRATPDSAGEAWLRERLDTLRRTEPATRITLLVDREAYDNRMSFAVLIREPAGRTVSVSVTDGGLPWPLRGVARATEFDLLRVNAVTMPIQEAFSSIDAMFDDRHILRSLVDACLLGEAIDAEGIEIHPGELQTAADSFRAARGLFTVEATNHWLRERSLSPEQFGQLVEQQAKISALRRTIVGDRVDALLGAAPDGTAPTFLQVAWVQVPAGTDRPDSEAAQVIGRDPLQAIVTARRDQRRAGLERWSSADVPERFSMVLDAPAGTVVRATDGPPALAVVVDRDEPHDAGAARERLTRRLFDEWLAERRRSADIQWFWGNERRTAQAVPQP